MRARSSRPTRPLALASRLLASLGAAGFFVAGCTVPDYVYDDGAYARARGLSGGAGDSTPGAGGASTGGAGGKLAGSSGGAGGASASSGGTSPGGSSHAGTGGAPGGHGGSGGAPAGGAGGSAASSPGGSGGAGGAGGTSGANGTGGTGDTGGTGGTAAGAMSGSAGSGNGGAGVSGSGGSAPATGGASGSPGGNGGMAGDTMAAGGTGMAGAGMAGAGMAGAGGTGSVEPPLGCLLKKFDFTSCALDFTPSGSKPSWQCGTPSGPEGPGGDHTSGSGALWATNVTGNANDCEDSTLTSPVFDLSTQGGKTVILRMWNWLSMRGCDPNAFGCSAFICGLDTTSYSGGVVEVDSDGMGTWKAVVPAEGFQNGGQSINCGDGMSMSTCALCALNGQVGFSAKSPQRVWMLSTFDVTAYATANFRFRLHFGSQDGYSCYPDTGGWYVDDIELGLNEACH